jgi:hypothetical protein
LHFALEITQASRLFRMHRKLVASLSDPALDILSCGRID